MGVDQKSVPVRYKTIIADPPWTFNHQGTNHYLPYPSMSTEDICALQIPAHDDCVLFMWSTWCHLADAMQVIDAWGFEYKTGLPWVKATGIAQTRFDGELMCKPYYGMGHWIRGCSEPILIAKRGKASPLTMDYVGLISPNAEHSRKPDDLYELAEQYDGPRLEMFGRRKRPGWDTWGNEVETEVVIDG